MKSDRPVPYLCPYTGAPLTLQVREGADGEVSVGVLRSATGTEYAIDDGVAHLVDFSRETFSDVEQREFRFYEDAAAKYDAIMEWVFTSFYENEDEVRESMVDLLRIPPDGLVLETGCGTCRDSMRMAHRLTANGTLFLQDLSPSMLRIGKEKIEAMRRQGEIRCGVEFFSGNALTLPFHDACFDAAFHFGGINLFGHKAEAVAEMARVVRKGGRVVFGDEGLAPWLRETEYGKILMNSSALYTYQAPIEVVPALAREVSVTWMIGNAYYLVSFTVGEGTPPLDLDLPILGRRGGTHRTRYYGALAGATSDGDR
jgi:ubiquinone/menaquinone biosynthesis C-methylase UbiE